MADIVGIVQVVRGGNFMNVLGKIYTYEETNLNNQLNDKSTLGYNKIF
jgi:hypothetical protein